MTVSDLNPFIRYARKHSTSISMKRDISICYDCRIFFFDNVTGTIRIGQKEYPLQDKSAVYLPPETAYRFSLFFKEDAKVIVFDFDLSQENNHLRDSLGTASAKDFDKSHVPNYSLPEQLNAPTIKFMPQAERVLMQCVDQFLYKNPYYREISSATLKLFLLDMIRHNAPNDQTEVSKNILSYIHQHFSDPSLTNKAIAEHFNYHPDYLSNLIRKETGKPLHQYLISYRLQIAKNYLLTTKHDISEIAWRCGFCTDAYFIKLFRESTGMTPRAYRRMHIHTEL